ncbi:MAG: periplasmic heavy metal sensor [Chloroflexi bacterium]|nr:periplasmic heavy metal sensor [Chloroflexota bacterium]
MKRISFLTTVFFIMIFMTAAIAFAMEPPPGEEMGPPPGMPGAASDKNFLKLNAKQEAAIKKIRDKYLIRREDLSLDIQSSRIGLIKLLRNDPPDKKAITAKIDELLQLERKRNLLLLDEYYEIRKILDPVQARLFTRILIREMNSKR